MARPLPIAEDRSGSVKEKQEARLHLMRRSSEYTDYTDSVDWTEDSWYLTMQNVI